MADHSDGEGFYDDPSEDESCGEPSVEEDDDDDDGCLGLCGGPSDEEGDDDSNGEGMREAPCCFDDDDDSDYLESPRDGDTDDEEGSEEALSDGDDDVQSEEVSGEEEGSGDEFIDDPCDEDGDGEAEDLREDPSDDDGEEGEDDYGEDFIDGDDDDEGDGEAEDLCEDTSSNDGQDWESSAEESSSEEDDRRGDAAGVNRGGEGVTPVALPTRTTPLPLTVQMLIDFMHTDSNDEDSDYDSGSDTDTDYDDGEYEPHNLPASRAVVEGLPEATLSEEEAACGCAVCKDVFASGERVVRLPCKHYFHGDCIRPWLAIRSTCPVCRYQLPTGDAEPRQRQERELMVLL